MGVVIVSENGIRLDIYSAHKILRELTERQP